MFNTTVRSEILTYSFTIIKQKIAKLWISKKAYTSEFSKSIKKINMEILHVNI